MSPTRIITISMVMLMTLVAVMMTQSMAQQQLQGITLLSSWFDRDETNNEKDMAWFRFQVNFADESFYRSPFLFSFEAAVQTKERQASNGMNRDTFPGIMVNFLPDAIDMKHSRDTFGVMLPLTADPARKISITPTMRFERDSAYSSMWGDAFTRTQGSHHIVIAVPINSFMLTSVPQFPISWTASFGIEVPTSDGTTMVLTSQLSDILQANQKKDILPQQSSSSSSSSSSNEAQFYTITKTLEKPIIVEPTTKTFRRYSQNTYPLAVDIKYASKAPKSAAQYVSRITQRLSYGMNLSGYGTSPTPECGVYRIITPSDCIDFDDCASTSWERDDSFNFKLTITNREILDLTIEPINADYRWDGLPRRYICTLPERGNWSSQFIDYRHGAKSGTITLDTSPVYCDDYSVRDFFPSLIRTSMYVTTITSNGQKMIQQVDDRQSEQQDKPILAGVIDNPLYFSPVATPGEDLSVTNSRRSKSFSTFCLSCEIKIPDFIKMAAWLIAAIVIICLLIPIVLIALCCCGCCGCIACLAQGRRGGGGNVNQSGGQLATFTVVTPSGYVQQIDHQQPYQPHQGGYYPQQQQQQQQGGYQPPQKQIN